MFTESSRKKLLYFSFEPFLCCAVREITTFEKRKIGKEFTDFDGIKKDGEIRTLNYYIIYG